MHRAATTLIVTLAVGGCTVQPPRPAAGAPESAMFIELPAIKGRNVVQLGIVIDPDLKPGTIVRGQTIGRYLPPPEDSGGPFRAELLDSRRRYDAGDHAGAAEVLRPLVESYQVDAFVQNAYARALYRTDKARAFDVYSRLVAEVDEMSGKEPGSTDIVVHSWFLEAYWKKGTLHLDREEWSEAASEISRYLLGTGLASTTLARLRAEPSAEQALQFLAEAYALMGEEEHAVRFARQTLQVAPGNTYVFNFVPREKVSDVEPR